MNQETGSQGYSTDENQLNDITNVTSDATTVVDSQQSENETDQEISHVTYIINQGQAVIYHRFELDLSPDLSPDHVEMVIKQGIPVL